jgi:hypothetical protein
MNCATLPHFRVSSLASFRVNVTTWTVVTYECAPRRKICITPREAFHNSLPKPGGDPRSDGRLRRRLSGSSPQLEKTGSRERLPFGHVRNRIGPVALTLGGAACKTGLPPGHRFYSISACFSRMKVRRGVEPAKRLPFWQVERSSARQSGPGSSARRALLGISLPPDVIFFC